MLPIKVSKIISLGSELRHCQRLEILSHETNMVTIKPLCFSHNKERGAMPYMVSGLYDDLT